MTNITVLLDLQFTDFHLHLKILNPSTNLINTESNLEEVENTLTDGLFFPEKKHIKEKIEGYIAIPTKNSINESYFFTIKAT